MAYTSDLCASSTVRFQLDDGRVYTYMYDECTTGIGIGTSRINELWIDDIRIWEIEGGW